MTGKLRTLLGLSAIVLVMAFSCLDSLATAGIIVQDTWLDGTRNDPAAPVYSENGTDSDMDGDIESVWYRGGAGTFDPVGPGGPLRGTGYAGSSASWTTYFTPEGSEVELLSPGDQLKVTWVFTPRNVNAMNASQGMRLALVDSPSAARLGAEGSPGSAVYSGYGVFMNMGQTIGHAGPFRLIQRVAGSDAFLSATSAWTTVADAPGFGSGAVGYANDTEYTFQMTITRDASNMLDVLATMSGGNLNGTGMVSVSATGIAPNNGNFKFDTFGLRPSNTAQTAETFDTRLFKVEFVPEPATTGMWNVLIWLAMLGARRMGCTATV